MYVTECTSLKYLRSRRNVLAFCDGGESAMMDDMEELERSLHEIGFSNFMIQKDIDKEHHMMKAREQAIEDLKQEFNYLISERNEYMKFGSLIETQAKSCQSHLISLGNSCHLLEEKGKTLLQEINTMKINLHKASLLFEQTLADYALLQTDFVDRYENLRNVALNNIAKNNVFILKQNIIEIEKNIAVVLSDLKNLEYLKYDFNVTCKTNVEHRNFFILIADSIFRRTILYKKVKENIITLNKLKERSQELSSNVVNSGAVLTTMKIEIKTEHDSMSTICATTCKKQDSLAFKLNPQSLTGLIKGRKTIRTFKAMEFLSSGLKIRGSTLPNLNESLDLESNIKKLKLNCNENIFSLNLPLKDKRCNSQYMKKDVNNGISRMMLPVFDPGNILPFSNEFLRKSIKVKDEERENKYKLNTDGHHKTDIFEEKNLSNNTKANSSKHSFLNECNGKFLTNSNQRAIALNFESFDGTINNFNEQRPEVYKNHGDATFSFISSSNHMTDLNTCFKDSTNETLTWKTPGRSANNQYKIF